MAFSEIQIQAVWEKGQEVDTFDSNKYRKDAAGAWMQRDKYGDVESPYGWEIDHVYPKAKDGKDELINLRPMHWANNRSKDGDYPTYTAVKTSDGNTNIDKTAEYTVNQPLQDKLKALHP